MKIIVNADDCGVSSAPFARMMEAHLRGRLDRIGVLPNGPALSEVARQLRQRPGLGISVHLNIVEGRPVGRPQDISLLVDGKGQFHHDFLTLWLSHATAMKRRRQIEVQVERELDVQIRRVRELFGLQTVNIDSHRYVHLIPFVMDILVKRARDWHIGMVRLVDEPLLPPCWTSAHLKNIFSINFVKVVLLKILSKRSTASLRRAGISTPDHFIGVLSSGHLSTSEVSRSLARLGRTAVRPDSVVEIAVHPVRLLPSELAGWTGSQSRNDFYCSPSRDREAIMLSDPRFARVIGETEAEPQAKASTRPAKDDGPVRSRRRPQSWVEYWNSESIFSTVMERTTDFFFDRSRSLMNWSENDVVLDVGCGPGYLAQRLRGLVHELYGVDTSSRAIEQCGRRFANTSGFHFHALDSEHFTDLSFLGTTKFTKIVCLSVVQYYHDESELEELIASVRRHAAADATLLVADIPVKPNVILDAIELLRAAFSHRLVRTSVEFVVKSRFSGYHSMRTSLGLLAFPLATLRRIIDSLGLDARIVHDPLTFNRRRVHLLIRLPHQREKQT